SPPNKPENNLFSFTFSVMVGGKLACSAVTGAQPPGVHSKIWITEQPKSAIAGIGSKQIAASRARDITLENRITLLLARQHLMTMPVRAPSTGRPPWHTNLLLIARVATASLDLIHHLGEVVACRRLHRRELLERLKPIEPQLLADG